MRSDGTGSSFTQIGTVDAAAYSFYADTAVEVGQQYSYQVVAASSATV